MDAGFRARFEERIEALARLSEVQGNLTRPSFTPSMKWANETLAAWMTAAGMDVRLDGAANLIGRYEGAVPNAQALMIGSHIDTVKDAGKYDGTLGVLLGLACVEELSRANRRLPFALEVIAFSDEEGLRFRLPYIGSRALTGKLTREDLELADENGVSLKAAIDGYGGLPVLTLDRRSPESLLGYLEVHIEQGPMLESTGRPVGVVSGISGQSRLEIGFTGVAGHAGTVPMSLRRDALVAAARFIVAVQETAREIDGLVATVGQIGALPGASNAIPGRAVISLDIRHMEDAVRHAALDKLYMRVQEVAAKERVEFDWLLIADNAAIPCAPSMVAALSEAVREAGIEPMTLASGAGHDAVMMSELTPVGMMFVRCRDGVSHNPAEFCEAADAETAADILMRALLILANRSG
jgi:hydantoinase/carbamoylase family amidase